MYFMQVFLPHMWKTRSIDPQQPPDIIDEEPEWEIERIIGHTRTNNKCYHIK
jgi:hypothetical protein